MRKKEHANHKKWSRLGLKLRIHAQKEDKRDQANDHKPKWNKENSSMSIN